MVTSVGCLEKTQTSIANYKGLSGKVEFLVESIVHKCIKFDHPEIFWLFQKCGYLWLPVEPQKMCASI